MLLEDGPTKGLGRCGARKRLEVGHGMQGATRCWLCAEGRIVPPSALGGCVRRPCPGGRARQCIGHRPATRGADSEPHVWSAPKPTRRQARSAAREAMLGRSWCERGALAGDAAPIQGTEGFAGANGHAESTMPIVGAQRCHEACSGVRGGAVPRRSGFRGHPSNHGVEHPPNHSLTTGYRQLRCMAPLPARAKAQQPGGRWATLRLAHAPRRRSRLHGPFGETGDRAPNWAIGGDDLQALSTT
jgi:hypothetical protein